MAISRRRLRFRLRFGFGLAAGLAALMLLVPAAYGAAPKAKPKPPGTAAADQYLKPTVVTYVTLTAAKVGKCKLAVVKKFTAKKKACKGKKACIAAATKAQTAAKKQCDRPARAATKTTKPKANPKPAVKLNVKVKP